MSNSPCPTCGRRGGAPDLIGPHKAEIIAMRVAGVTFDDIGRVFGVTGVAIFNRIKRWRPELLGSRKRQRSSTLMAHIEGR